MSELGHWNYRITLDAEGEYTFREVYYDENGKVVGWTSEETAPFSESLEGLRRFIEEALAKPVLDITDESNPVEVTDAAQ